LKYCTKYGKDKSKTKPKTAEIAIIVFSILSRFCLACQGVTLRAVLLRVILLIPYASFAMIAAFRAKITRKAIATVILFNPCFVLPLNTYCTSLGDSQALFLFLLLHRSDRA
jgi:hypothetical protein